MIKVTDIVNDLIQTDELALEAMRAELLNFSAYADKIHSQVENLTKKPVQKGTIVVTLSRISKQAKSLSQPLKPHISLQNLSVKTPLCVLSFQKTQDVERRLSTLSPFLVSSSDLFGICHSQSEATLVCSEKATRVIKKHFDINPKREIINCAAVTLEISQNLADTPNVLYVLLSSLAQKRINIVEIISTYTEISFIVKAEQLEETVAALHVYSK